MNLSVIIHLGVYVLLPIYGAVAGPYALGRGDPTNLFDPGVPGFTGVDGDGAVGGNNTVNPRFVAWADKVISYQPANSVSPSWTNSTNALGMVTGDHIDIVSLGELNAAAIQAGDSPGSITLGFGVIISDGPGPDFAVFENGFTIQGAENYIYAELAYVEVSSDGTNFARFPSVSLDEPGAYVTNAPGGTAFAFRDATTIYNLAGKHANHSSLESWGTPFDLGTLKTHSNVVSGKINLGAIHYVRIVDLPGSGDFLDAQVPAQPIFDGWESPAGSAGFDLEAIGVLNFSTICETIYRNGRPELDWHAVTNRMYQVQRANHAGQTTWTNVGTMVMGDNQLHTLALTNATEAASAVFRVLQSEVP